MKDIYILIIISFIIHKSIELEPEGNYLNRNLEDNEIPSYNWTEPESEPEPKPEISYVKPTTKPVLLGFFFKKTEKNEEKYLKAFFKNVANKSIFTQFIFFFITIIEKVRVLEDGSQNSQILVKGVLNETSLSTDNVEYIVKNDENDENYEKIDKLFNGTASAQMEKPNIIFIDNKEDAEKIEAIKQLLNNTNEDESAVAIMSDTVLKDITEQEYNPETIIFFLVQNIRKIGSQSYKLTGNFSKPFEIENNKEIITFNYKYISQINTFDATLTKLNDGNYQMSFSIPNYIEIDLNAAWANITERKITMQRRLETNNYYEQLQFKETFPNQLELPLPSPETHSFGGKIGSSSGLSGMAIAFIVIGSVLVLICVGIAAIYLSRSKPKQNDASAIEFYNSSLSVVQDQ